ncbi:MAG: hypothetical protein KF847_09575 [Pirellulales bacterium]|nr:hypothetical protein [Pirellulales bacterium]
MTTRPSSSQPEISALQLVLVDGAGREVVLGDEIGRGGEGTVFEVVGRPELAAKLYKKSPLDEEQTAKFRALVERRSAELDKISAWPQGMLFNPGDNVPLGLVMSRVVGARSLHELYGTTNRRRHFPDAQWRHLLLAARNIAAAFHTLHDAGVVLGDVNQGNMLVDSQMMVRLIDCDSFQISTGERLFTCPVGTPHFTPPELQTLKLREVARTVEHDRFGLAVLVFHMLFVGRHPYAGRFRRTGDLSIERAIAERRFAFSRDRHETLVDPPPASLHLEDLPPGLAVLFETAFRGEPRERPEPIDWIRSLESLIKECKLCSYDAAHVYFRGLKECPWCRIEDAGGPSFFVADAGGTMVSKDRLAALELKISRLSPVTFPAVPATTLAPPKMALVKAATKPGRRTAVDWAVYGLVAAWGLCLAGTGWGPLLAAGTVGSLAAGGYLVFGRPGKERRLAAHDQRAKIDAGYEKATKLSQMIKSRHEQRQAAFDRMSEELKAEAARYLAKGDKLQSVIAESAQIQKAEYLRGFLIGDEWRSIPGMSRNLVTILESFGVENANDVDPMILHGVPYVDDEAVLELVAWRRDKEHSFSFAPDHGVTVQDLKAQGELAERRFKASQARRILTAAKQREEFAATAREQLAREVAQYEKVADEWREQAKRFRDWQSSRRKRERQLNDNPAVLIGLATGIPAVAALLWLMLG